MIRHALFGLVLPLLLLGVGCGDDDDSGGPLVWNPPDAGIPSRPDASTGRPDASGRVCFPLEALPAEELPRCRAATQQCRTSCMEPGADDCRDTCLAADDYPPLMPPGGDPVSCGDCLFRQSITCIADNGCANEVNAFLCCIVDECAAGGPGCIEMMCADQVGAMFACGAIRAPSCFDETSGAAASCYADSDPPQADGGVPPDAGAPTDGGML